MNRHPSQETQILCSVVNISAGRRQGLFVATSNHPPSLPEVMNQTTENGWGDCVHVFPILNTRQSHSFRMMLPFVAAQSPPAEHEELGDSQPSEFFYDIYVAISPFKSLRHG